MRKFSRVVITSGTSALGAYNAAGVWLKAHPPAGVTVGQSLKVTDLDKALTAVAEWKQQPAPTNHQQVSAEYSVLHALRTDKRLVAGPSVVLIHTATPEGSFAAHLVAASMEREFNAAVRLVPVADVDVQNPATLRRSLGSFLHKIRQELDGHTRDDTCFAPLGGYKVMTTLGYVSGAIAGFPSGYVHEQNQRYHEIPPMPMRIDETSLETIEPLIRRAVSGIPRDTLSATDAELVTEFAWLFEDDGEYVFLNELGHYLREHPKYRGTIGPRVFATKSVAKLLAETGSRVFLRDQAEVLRERTASPTEHQGTLHHEANYGHRDTPYALFKGASNAAGMFRAAWQKREDCLYLSRVWLDHDSYEHEFKSGAVLTQEPTDFVDITRQLFA